MPPKTRMQSAAPQRKEPSHHDLLRQGDYLGALRLLQERWPNESTRLQILSWVLGAVGRYPEAQQTFNDAMNRHAPPSLPSPQELEAIQALPLDPAERVVLQ